MSQTVITTAFEQWKARQGESGEAVLLDEFVLANVPGLDPTKPVNRDEALPPAAQIVHRQAITRKGVVNENAVVHSVVIGADVGDFSFNWIGLINKASGTLAMIVHAPAQQKLKTKDGQQGNVLTRSFLMEYSGAQQETGISTPAETWQIDFTARMAGMDERQRIENVDIYGAAAFFGDGWLVSKTGSQFFVTKGAGYAAGLRAELAANQNISVSKKPAKVWLDVCWSGSLASVWAVESKITVADALSDYELAGKKHFVFALASIDASGNITDLRPKGSLSDQSLSDAIKQHEKSRNHPDATLSEKGFTKLSSAINSESEILSATPKAVKAVNDNAASRVSKSGDTMTGRLNLVTGAASEALRMVNDSTKSANYMTWYDIDDTWIGYLGRGGANKELAFVNRIGNNFVQLHASGAISAQCVSFTVSGSLKAASVDIAGAIDGQYFTTSNAVGAGAYAAQYGVQAPFYNEFSDAGASVYHPLWKQKWSNGGVVWSGGMLVNNGDFKIHAISSSGGQIGFTFGRSGIFIPDSYANFDARYQARGSFVTAVRLGASGEYQERSNNERLAGGVMTSFADRGSSNYWIRLRPLQYLVNGAWVTAAYA